MDVRFTEEQTLLRESARALLERECSMGFVRALIEDERGNTDALWNKAVEMGWTGLACDDRYGGAGLGVVEMAVLMEEAGRVLMPGPLLSTLAVGTTAISLAGSETQKSELLPRVVDGTLRIALAQLEVSAGWGPEGIEARAQSSGEGYTLAGTKLFVADAAIADMLLVPALTDEGHRSARLPILRPQCDR